MRLHLFVCVSEIIQQVMIAPIVTRPLYAEAEVSRPFHFFSSSFKEGRSQDALWQITGCCALPWMLAQNCACSDCFVASRVLPCVLQRPGLDEKFVYDYTAHFSPRLLDPISTYHAPTSLDVSRHPPTSGSFMFKSQNALRIRIVLCTRVEPASLGYTNIYDILDMRQALYR